jgi:hypothetical protein
MKIDMNGTKKLDFNVLRLLSVSILCAFTFSLFAQRTTVWTNEQANQWYKQWGWGRTMNPSQPLSAGYWSDNLKELSKFQLENSDVITYHTYNDAASHRQLIELLRASTVENGAMQTYKCGGYILAYDKPFGDFILKCDVKMDSERPET